MHLSPGRQAAIETLDFTGAHNIEGGCYRHGRCDDDGVDSLSRHVFINHRDRNSCHKNFAQSQSICSQHDQKRSSKDYTLLVTVIRLVRREGCGLSSRFLWGVLFTSKILLLYATHVLSCVFEELLLWKLLLTLQSLVGVGIQFGDL